MRRIHRRWVGCEVCRSRLRHRSVMRYNRRLEAEYERGRR